MRIGGFVAEDWRVVFAKNNEWQSHSIVHSDDWHLTWDNMVLNRDNLILT